MSRSIFDPAYGTPEPTEQELSDQVIADVLAKHHAAFKYRKDMEATLRRELPPFEGELNDLQLLEMANLTATPAVLRGENAGTPVWPGASFDDPTRTAADAQRDQRKLKQKLAADEAKRKIAELQASLVLDEDGEAVGSRPNPLVNPDW